MLSFIDTGDFDLIEPVYDGGYRRDDEGQYYRGHSLVTPKADACTQTFKNKIFSEEWTIPTILINNEPETNASLLRRIERHKLRNPHSAASGQMEMHDDSNNNCIFNNENFLSAKAGDITEDSESANNNSDNDKTVNEISNNENAKPSDDNQVMTNGSADSREGMSTKDEDQTNIESISKNLPVNNTDNNGSNNDSKDNNNDNNKNNENNNENNNNNGKNKNGNNNDNNENNNKNENNDKNYKIYITDETTINANNTDKLLSTVANFTPQPDIEELCRSTEESSASEKEFVDLPVGANDPFGELFNILLKNTRKSARTEGKARRDAKKNSAGGREAPGGSEAERQPSERAIDLSNFFRELPFKESNPPPEQGGPNSTVVSEKRRVYNEHPTHEAPTTANTRAKKYSSKTHLPVPKKSLESILSHIDFELPKAEPKSPFKEGGEVCTLHPYPHGSPRKAAHTEGDISKGQILPLPHNEPNITIEDPARFLVENKENLVRDMHDLRKTEMRLRRYILSQDPSLKPDMPPTTSLITNTQEQFFKLKYAHALNELKRVTQAIEILRLLAFRVEVYRSLAELPREDCNVSRQGGKAAVDRVKLQISEPDNKSLQPIPVKMVQDAYLVNRKLRLKLRGKNLGVPELLIPSQCPDVGPLLGEIHMTTLEALENLKLLTEQNRYMRAQLAIPLPLESAPTA